MASNIKQMAILGMGYQIPTCNVREQFVGKIKYILTNITSTYQVCSNTVQAELI